MADQQRRGAVPDIAAAVGVLLGGNDAAGGGLKGRGHDKHRPGLTAETEAEGTPAIGAEALHGFKGGKGVSAGAAIALCIDWRAGLLTIAVFAIAALCSKKVSFGSICAALSLPVWALVLELSQPRCALAIVGMCLVVIRHRENIKRLISGTEPDFKPGKSKRIERN